jgi:alkanesulfonate monooxygenase SsuD/methylene tetrahydromethanopterin reductase-like flavin-dependent oxidoreductase (luciferase family)
MQTLDIERKLAERYRGLCTRYERESMVCLMRNAWVGPTRADVERDWLDEALRFHLDYWRAGARGRDDEGLYRRLEAGERVNLADFTRDRAVAGTPDDCIVQIERCSELTGCDALLLALTGRRDSSTIRRTVELFGKEVLPAFSS